MEVAMFIVVSGCPIMSSDVFLLINYGCKDIAYLDT